MLSERHFTIRVGGKHAVCDVTTATHAVLPQKASDFTLRYLPHKYDVNGRSQSLGQIWLNWPDRRSYDGELVCKPIGADDAVSTNDFNTWRGFRVAPHKGDWRLFREHLGEVVCRGNETHSPTW